MALKIDNEVVKTAMTEVLLQNASNFTAGTAGAITLSSHYIMGDAEEYSQLAEIATLIGRRDITVDTDATVKAINSRDENNVIVYFSTGSIEFKKVDARRYGSDVAGFSAAIGEQIGVGFINFMLNTGISATVGAIQSEATAVTGDGTAALTFGLLNDSIAKFGDASGSIVAFVMNGAQFHKLVGDSITNYKVDSIAGGSINEGTVGTLGRPVYVTDAAGLLIDDTIDYNAVLGLTVNALKLAESETREVFSEVVGGKENLKVRIQAESDVLLNVKGYSYTGTANPTTVELQTSTNWSNVATDVKSTAGVLLKVLV